MIGDVPLGRPGVAVGGEDAVAVEVVQQRELLSECVMVRRHRPAEDTEPRVPVAARQIAEKLVVGPVLLDDVDHVLENGRLAGPLRYRQQRPPRARTAHPPAARVPERSAGYPALDLAHPAQLPRAD